MQTQAIGVTCPEQVTPPADPQGCPGRDETLYRWAVAHLAAQAARAMDAELAADQARDLLSGTSPKLVRFDLMCDPKYHCASPVWHRPTPDYLRRNPDKAGFEWVSKCGKCARCRKRRKATEIARAMCEAEDALAMWGTTLGPGWVNRILRLWDANDAAWKRLCAITDGPTYWQWHRDYSRPLGLDRDLAQQWSEEHPQPQYRDWLISSADENRHEVAVQTDFDLLADWEHKQGLRIKQELIKRMRKHANGANFRHRNICEISNNDFEHWHGILRVDGRYVTQAELMVRGIVLPGGRTLDDYAAPRGDESDDAYYTRVRPKLLAACDRFEALRDDRSESARQARRKLPYQPSILGRAESKLIKGPGGKHKNPSHWMAYVAKWAGYVNGEGKTRTRVSGSKHWGGTRRKPEPTPGSLAEITARAADRDSWASHPGRRQDIRDPPKTAADKADRNRERKREARQQAAADERRNLMDELHLNTAVEAWLWGDEHAQPWDPDVMRNGDPEREAWLTNGQPRPWCQDTDDATPEGSPRTRGRAGGSSDPALHNAARAWCQSGTSRQDPDPADRAAKETPRTLLPSNATGPPYAPETSPNISIRHLTKIWPQEGTPWESH